MGISLAIFLQINNLGGAISSAQKGKKPNNSFPKILSENF